MKNVSEKENITYWNEFYKKVMIDKESSFCTFVKGQFSNNFSVIDVGCGSGRDTRAFAKDGYNIVGIDRSIEVIEANNNQVNKIQSISFENIDVGDIKEFALFLQRIRNRFKAVENKILIYSRFFLHSINADTEEVMFNLLSDSLQKGDKLALEFRTLEDQRIGKIYDNHYRRFIDSDALKMKLEERYSFKIEYYYKGQGLSIFQGEDPYLARILCTKK